MEKSTSMVPKSTPTEPQSTALALASLDSLPVSRAHAIAGGHNPDTPGVMQALARVAFKGAVKAMSKDQTERLIAYRLAETDDIIADDAADPVVKRAAKYYRARNLK